MPSSSRQGIGWGGPRHWRHNHKQSLSRKQKGHSLPGRSCAHLVEGRKTLPHREVTALGPAYPTQRHRTTHRRSTLPLPAHVVADAIARLSGAPHLLLPPHPPCAAAAAAAAVEQTRGDVGGRGGRGSEALSGSYFPFFLLLVMPSLVVLSLLPPPFRALRQRRPPAAAAGAGSVSCRLLSCDFSSIGLGCRALMMSTLPQHSGTRSSSQHSDTT